MDYYTLDRIEDENTAVLIDDNGKKTDISAIYLPLPHEPGNVYSIKDGSFVYERSETELRRERIRKKKNSLFARIKNTGDNNKGS